MNPTLVIYQRLKAMLEADAGITDVVTGFNRNYFDDDAATAAERSRRTAADAPTLALELDPAVTNATGGVVTFGQRDGGAEVCNYGVPVRLGFRLILKTQSDHLLKQLELEQAAERALLKSGRTLGVPWVGMIQPISWQRRREPGTNKSDWTSTGGITVTGRPALSLLTAP